MASETRVLRLMGHRIWLAGIAVPHLDGPMMCRNGGIGAAQTAQGQHSRRTLDGRTHFRNSQLAPQVRGAR